MIKGAVAKLNALCQTGDVEGMISIGGVSTMVMAASIMREMPYRITKLILSSAGSVPGTIVCLIIPQKDNRKHKKSDMPMFVQW
jgi:uncharacterized protein (UPF0261 family)